MYEAMDRPIPDVAGYLERIGLDSPPAVDLDGLNALVWGHQTHVPFEDLNTAFLGQPVSLEIPTLYEKVVTRRRGGYCFELNLLFARLLLDLGFDARLVFCRIVRGRDFLPPSLHCAIVVSLAGRRYFCDVGYGGPMPGGALEIGDGIGRDIWGEYFRIDRFDEYWWVLSRDTSGGEREAVLQFNTFPQIPQEFLTANMKCERDPESIFVRQLMVNLRTEEGSLSLTGDVFTERYGGAVREERLVDEDALRQVLRERFGIALEETEKVSYHIGKQ